MDLFTHLYAILGIAIRLPEIEPDGQQALFKNAITILKRAEKIAHQSPEPLAATRQKIALMRTAFVHWRGENFTFQHPDQRTIIATSVELAGEKDHSDL
ncbi:MAG TPA: hypothetical protein VHM90_18475 [Phycisphaerae bacterium]|nr:hypothetical protein [Phycisphaerae bacterium]